MTITYAILTEMHELEQVCELEYTIWGRDYRTVTPAVVMRIANAHGGVTLGAFDDDGSGGRRMIGMSWAFAVPRDDSPSGLALWSHITGVLPEYRSQRVGFELKQRQRAWALEHGYTAIHWTFDPMQAKNAHFNFCILGAVVRKYKPNFYGVFRDNLNPGLPSDRFEATWPLTSARAVQAAQTGAPLPPLTEEFPETAFLVRYTSGALRLNLPDRLTAPHYFVEIPTSYSGLMARDAQIGAQWQAGLRAAMLHATGQGYSVMDFVRMPDACWHVLAREVVRAKRPLPRPTPL